MTTNKHGIETATRDELMAIWVFDDDLFRLFAYSEWLMWCRITGVRA